MAAKSKKRLRRSFPEVRWALEERGEAICPESHRAKKAEYTF